MTPFASVVPALRQVSVLLSLRLLPFAVYAALSASSARGRRALLGASYVAVPALACWLGAASTIRSLAAIAAYYVAVGLGTNRVRGAVAAGGLTRGAAFTGLFFAYVVLPAITFRGPGVASIIVFGCELALSSYSYCLDTTRPGARPARLGDCLFFLFVNPTVVYAASGERALEPPRLRGLARAAGGMCIIFANLAVLWPCAQRLGAARTASAGAAWGSWLLFGVARFLTEYAAHSGLASLHIGLMRQLGWVVPERYRHPLLATSPMDFWRRWNTYVRVWLESYVYLPLAMWIARRTRRRAGQIAAAIVTLGASGLLHGAVAFASQQSPREMTRPVAFFLTAGALLAVWRAAGALGRTIRVRLEGSGLRRYDLFAGWLGRSGLWSAVVAAVITWG